MYRIVLDEFSSSSLFYHSFPQFVFFLQRRSGLYIAFSMGLFLVGFHGIFFDRRYCVSGAGVLVSRETQEPPSGSGFMFFFNSPMFFLFLDMLVIRWLLCVKQQGVCLRGLYIGLEIS